MFKLSYVAVLNCTEVNVDCNCTQDKCSNLPNTVCNPETGACECDEDGKYLFEDGKCEKEKGLYCVFKLDFTIHSGYNK